MPDDKAQGSVAEAPVKAEAPAVAPAEIADKKTPVAASPKQDSAPAENKRDTTASDKTDVKASDKAVDGSKQDAKTKFEFIKKRQELKQTKVTAEELSKRNAELEARLKEFESKKAEPKNDEDIVGSMLENPTKFKEDIKREAINEFLAIAEQRERENLFARASAEAESYLLTRSHVRDPEFAKDVQAKFEKLQHIAQTGDMQSVAELAYYRTCKERGVVADDLNLGPDKSAKGSIGVSPSATNSDGPKRWAPGEIQKYLDSAPNIDALKMRLAELEKARNEGRA